MFITLTWPSLVSMPEFTTQPKFPTGSHSKTEQPLVLSRLSGRGSYTHYYHCAVHTTPPSLLPKWPLGIAPYLHMLPPPTQQAFHYLHHHNTTHKVTSGGVTHNLHLLPPSRPRTNSIPAHKSSEQTAVCTSHRTSSFQPERYPYIARKLGAGP